MAEILLVNVALPYFSYSARHFLPYQLQPLTFNTKHGTLPRDYVLVVGDSYAAGMGSETTYNTSRTSTSTNHYLELLHQQTDRDFLNLGIEGAGNLRGFFLHPVSVFEALHDTAFVRTLDSPSTIIALFYEGNDFIDNLEFASRHLDFQLTDSTYQSRELDHRMQNLINKYRAGFQGERPRLFAGMRFLLRAVWREYGQNYANQSSSVEFPSPESPNGIRRGLKSSSVPDNLALPPISLDLWQTTIATDLMVRSLLLLRSKMNPQSVYLFYIPSVATCYESFEGKSIVLGDESAKLQSKDFSLVDQMRYLQSRFKTDKQGQVHMSISQDTIRAANRFLVEQTRLRLRETEIKFVDLTVAFQNAARKTAIHGPTDWDHLNPIGQKLLADEIEKAIFQL